MPRQSSTHLCLTHCPFFLHFLSPAILYFHRQLFFIADANGEKQGNGNEYGSLGAGKLNLRDVTSFHLLFFHSHASFLSVLVDGGDRSIKANMRERDTVTQRENKRFQKWKGKENIWAGKEKEKDHGSERGRRNWTERRQSAEEELFHTNTLLWITNRFNDTKPRCKTALRPLNQVVYEKFQRLSFFRLHCCPFFRLRASKCWLKTGENEAFVS